MAKKSKPITVQVNVAEHLRNSLGADKTEAMRQGVRQRATTFRARKGKGSYVRKAKHKGEPS